MQYPTQPQFLFPRQLGLGGSIALSLACAFSPAQAQTVTNAMLLATGSYQLEGGALEALQDGPSSGSVDVLAFPPNIGNSSAGLHSYGDPSGTFGSRSSGSGLFDVTGAFQIQATVTNDSSTAQVIKFKFYITPGQISNEVNAALTGSQFLLSGTKFNIAVNGNSVWTSSASLRSDASGLGQFSSSGVNLYAGSGLQRAIVGGNYEVDLGVLNAGQSLQLVYDLQTNASGNSPAGAGVLVPEQRFTVPDQWIDFTGGDCNVCYGQFQPGEVVVIPEYTTPGTPGGAHGSSGDPFSFDGTSLTPDYRTSGATLPFGQFAPFSVTMAPVPEPSAYGLMLGGLGLVGWLARRRRQQPAG